MKIKLLVNIPKKNKIPDFFNHGYDEYEKRLSRFCKIERIYYKNEKDLAKHLKDGQKVFTIKDDGVSLTSEQLGELILNLSVESHLHSDIVFILSKSDFIGESFTISNAQLSIEMEQLILLEQIYRGYKIINNESYHK